MSLNQTDDDWSQLCAIAEGERDAALERADEAEKNLSGLHVRLRQALGAESVDEVFDLIASLREVKRDLDELKTEIETRQDDSFDAAELDRVTIERDEARDALSIERHNVATLTDALKNVTNQRDAAQSEIADLRAQCISFETEIAELEELIDMHNDSDDTVDHWVDWDTDSKP